MNDIANGPSSTVEFAKAPGVGDAVGRALRHHRMIEGLAIRTLGEMSGVSPAMISRIENAQVSPSLATLEALAAAMSLPVISFFQHTIQTADINFVKAGRGLSAKRHAPNHIHDFMVLAKFADNALEMNAAQVTLDRDNDGKHPTYFARGFVFLTVLKGRCTYSCGGTEFQMEPGDCLSFDAQLRHGVHAVTTKQVTFITVAAYPR